MANFVNGIFWLVEKDPAALMWIERFSMQFFIFLDHEKLCDPWVRAVAPLIVPSYLLFYMIYN